MSKKGRGNSDLNKTKETFKVRKIFTRSQVKKNQGKMLDKLNTNKNRKDQPITKTTTLTTTATTNHVEEKQKKKWKYTYFIRAKHANGYIEDDILVGFDSIDLPTPMQIFGPHYGYRPHGVKFQSFHQFHPDVANFPIELDINSSFPEQYVDGSYGEKSFFVVTLTSVLYKGKEK